MKIVWERKIDGDKYGDWELMRYLVKMDNPYSEDEITYDLRDRFVIPRCYHEHDCCGCISSYITEIMDAEGSYLLVEVSYNRNV